MIREEVFIYQELTSDGENIGDPRIFNWAGLQMHISLTCAAYPIRNLRHMVDLLKAAHRQGFTGNPVDLTLWNKEKTALTWSARLWLQKSGDDVMLTATR